MPSASPSPVKRPSLNERTSSTHSLSSSGRQATGHKAHRPHVVNRHARNVSHGKGLVKLGKVHSTANITTDLHHQRKRSGGTTPPHSPRASIVKRNSSHVVLPKDTSFGNLRKNKSANALARNLSHPALKKVGLAPAPKPKHKHKKDGVFQLGDHSSDEEEEEEWEDSTTQSPELTRNNSKTSTPNRASTPNGEELPNHRAESDIGRPDKMPSPPSPYLTTNNRSAPDLRRGSGISPSQVPSEPPLLHQNHRASRAPPAMSTVSAHVDPTQMMRSESSRSFTHISHADAASANATPSTPAPAPVPGASSVDAGGVSHFLPTDTPGTSLRHNAVDGSDEDPPSDFLSHYKPQPSESPERTKTIHKARLPQNASRTQQRLELQRREMMRAGAATPTTHPPTGMGLPYGSTTSLHGRQASRNRNRALAGEVNTVKQDYETAIKHLLVVRRFRSPIVESLTRLKENNILPAEIGGATASPWSATKGRPQSRREPSSATVNGLAKSVLSRSLDDHKSSPPAPSTSTKTRGGRVHFQRRNSHDDIEVTPSQGSPDEHHIDDHEGLSPEEELIRRIWDSRHVFES
ncbi:hypothetical protein HRR83_005026 [Exophiala dermatitidis]|uniref:Uncharacterized protein n=2 Tax=Exophiala dermatitidis TaxID=5970 RepID=H6C399_EXODN|nr:uncharacterized protein HMPREF1120_06132 [Exophiala dermatitidis NIH/UT8656]KAJ4513818.1 hypothetical protein HRR75_004399 [Exophiala dermatitidis]EHY58114.1 hypothetical protein HMPREF1120_06132 [Exophiala dermatitidis NIH/UT8656]KAJ4517061.1 hypothetical protein HRR74_004811 [Exophiala dermatitidis]KAJ4519762.1 hypothetical protein HRR73_003822 [Exophiala dermatitidis]KAJ4534435.1 hypothetical protein HRR76_006361 [Exophiala dermatitidis]